MEAILEIKRDKQYPKKGQYIDGEWASVPEIAEEIRCSPTIIYRILDKLNREGREPLSRFENPSDFSQPIKYFITREHLPSLKLRDGRLLSASFLSQRIPLDDYIKSLKERGINYDLKPEILSEDKTNKEKLQYEKPTIRAGYSKLGNLKDKNLRYILRQAVKKPEYLNTELWKKIIESKKEKEKAVHFPLKDMNDALLYLISNYNLTLKESRLRNLAVKYKLYTIYNKKPIVLDKTLDIAVKDHNQIKEFHIKRKINKELKTPKHKELGELKPYYLEKQSQKTRIRKNWLNTKNISNILNKKEVAILRLRYGIGETREHTLQEIGEMFGVCRERIRQIEKKAIRKIEHPQQSEELKPYHTTQIIKQRKVKEPTERKSSSYQIKQVDTEHITSLEEGGILFDSVEELTPLEEGGILFDSVEELSLDEKEISIGNFIDPLYYIYNKEIRNYQAFKPKEEREHAKNMHKTLEEIAKTIFSQTRFSSKYFRMIFNKSDRLESFKELMPNRAHNTGYNSTKKYLEGIIKELSNNKEIEEIKKGNPKSIMSLVDVNHEFSHLKNIYSDIRFIKEKITDYEDESKRKTMLKSAGFRSLDDIKKLLDRIENSTNNYKILFDEFVNRNYRLVIKIANKYRYGRMEMLDAIQEGNIGLIRATERFDYRKGYKFSSYATWWIHQSIIRAIDEKTRTIRIPVHIDEKIRKLIKTARDITQEGGRDATPDEIAKRLNMNVEKISELLETKKTPISLYKTLNNYEDKKLIDTIENKNALSPERSAISTETSKKIEDILKVLNDKEVAILRLRYGIGETGEHTLEEIGEMFGLCRERIRQLEKRAIRKLKHENSGKLKEIVFEQHNKYPDYTPEDSKSVMS